MKTKTTRVSVQFKVFRVSENTNSFGLKQCYMMAKDGLAFKACANTLNMPTKDSVINVDVLVNEDGKFVNHCLAERGFEIPERLFPNAPPEVVKEVWGE